MESVEKPDAARRSRFSTKKKIAVFGGVLLVVIALAVGLGVGLTRNKGGDDGGVQDRDSGDTPKNCGNPPAATPSGNSSATSTWRPKAGDTWQIVLRGAIDVSQGISPDVSVYDIDMYENTPGTIKTLHDAGKKVVCYFSAGSYEDWRVDAGDFKAEDKGLPLIGWPGEYWIKLSSPNVRGIMSKRIAQAAAKGCDAIDPDNVDGYQNKNGLGLTEQDSIDFMKFLQQEAAKYNMSTGLKNAGDIVKDVLPFIDFCVNEQCVENTECEMFKPFIEAGKPVFHIEYPGDETDKVTDEQLEDICSRKGPSVGADNFSTVMKKMNLDGWVKYCDGKSYTTKMTKS